MKKRRYLLFLLCFVFAACLCTGCGQKKEEQKHYHKASDTIKIGVSFDSFVIERWLRDRDSFENSARKLNAEVIVQNANGKLSEQVEQINYLIKKDVDAIVIIASDCDNSRMTSVITKAHEKGIKVIAYDRLIMHAPIDLFLSFDNEKIGHIMAKGLLKKCGEKPEILMIAGSRTDQNVKELNAGFEAEAAKAGATIVEKDFCTQWKAEEAVGYLERALKKYPDIQGIMCGNDDVATQVAKVLAENQKLGKIQIVGQDADLLACQRIVEKTQLLTVYKNVDDLARMAAYYTVGLIQGKSVESIRKKTSTTLDDQPKAATADNGKMAVKSILLAPKEVNKNNIDSVIIDSNYHTKEDVYLNVEASKNKVRRKKK